MKITYKDDTKIIFEDETRTFTFIKNKYNVEGNIQSSWILLEYQERFRDGIDLLELSVNGATSYNNNGYSVIDLSYHTNNLLRREIWLKGDCETVSEDGIIIFNPRFKRTETKQYYAIVPEDIKLMDYLDDNNREFYLRDDDSKSFINNVLDDSIVEDFLFYNKYYGNILNEYFDDESALTEQLSGNSISPERKKVKQYCKGTNEKK